MKKPDLSIRPQFRKGTDMERVERRLSAAIAIVLCALTVAAQVATILLLTTFLREKAGYFYLLLQAGALGNAIRVYQRPGSPSYKLAWMCLLIASPVAGMILFYLWGGTRQAKDRSMKRIPSISLGGDRLRESMENLEQLRARSPRWGRLAAYLQKRHCLLYRNTQAAYFQDGTAFFADLTARLAQAERYIFLEFYILAEGILWDRIFEVLKNRVEAGVEIYILCDDFGNLFRLSGDTLRAMQDARLEVQLFNPVHRSGLRAYFNYRDHRKLVVIDGQTAYTGGINLADEYANLVERFGYWKDSGVRVEGDAAAGFAAQFIRMWKMTGRTFAREDDYYLSAHPMTAAEQLGSLDGAAPDSAGRGDPADDALPEEPPPVEDIAAEDTMEEDAGGGVPAVEEDAGGSVPAGEEEAGGGVPAGEEAEETAAHWSDFPADEAADSSSAWEGFCQPFSDGPLRNPDYSIEETYLQLISSAERMVYLTTPYYAVEESMQKALCIAADAGVDVRLFVPAIPDHKVPYMVAETYWGELLRHGVKIYKYSPGFIHAKSVLADQEAALVGTTNMDYRTFQLHYECGVLMYHMPAIEELRKDLENIIRESHLYTYREWNQRPWIRRVFASILKVGAIWL